MSFGDVAMSYFSYRTEYNLSNKEHTLIFCDYVDIVTEIQHLLSK